MNKKIVLLLLILTLFSFVLHAEKYAGEIFRMGAGVRNFALGGCGITDTETTALAYWNPSLLANINETKFELMHAEEYSGLLTYDTFSAIVGKNTKFSFVLTRIGIDDIPLTKLDEETNRPYAYKSVNNSDLIAYFGFSREVLGLHFGFTPKVAYRSLAEHSGYGFGADVAATFRISEKLISAVNIRDFFSTQILWENGSHEIVNPSVDMELRYSFLLPLFRRNTMLFVGSNYYTENRDYASTVSMGMLSMDFHTGMDVTAHPNFHLLMGYDVSDLTSGVSLSIRNWQLHYGFKYNTELDNSHRLSVSYIL